ncbi:hypothetical protein AXH82_00150 [Microbacterium sp. PAMC 28756]|nr:hypothetical protein AXH82_00150 [Microbacterium sp. PAMC 28756]
MADWTCHGVSQWLPGVTDRRFIGAVPRGIALAFSNGRPWSGWVHADFEHHSLGIVDECRPRQGFGLSLRSGDRLFVRCIGCTETFEPELVEKFPAAGAQLLGPQEVVVSEFTVEERSQHWHWVLAAMQKLPDDLPNLVTEVVERNPGGDSCRVVPAVGEDDGPRFRRLRPQATEKLGHRHLVELCAT